jgi:hypothetical protein
MADPRGVRLAAWQGLTDDSRSGEEEDLSEIERRKAAGEIGEDLDPRVVLLLCVAAVTVPIVMPQQVRAIFGLDPGSPEFQEHYTDQLRRVIRRLA